MPEVSVIMSTYNEKREYLTAAIESVRKQTFCDYEFLIVLDNPQNEMIRECVLQYAAKDSRICVIENERNLGLTKSLNKAIQAASGVYMSRMDADDIMAETCLERELAEIREKSLDLVSVSRVNIDEHGCEQGMYINDFSPEQMKRLLPYDNSVTHPSVMVRLELVRKEGGYREIPACEDYDLWLRLLHHGSRMRIMPDVLLQYRVRAEGICGSDPYRQYLSKKYLMSMCKKSKKDTRIWERKESFKEYISRQDVSQGRKERFNHAYEEMYRGIAFLRGGKYWRGGRLLLQAVVRDWEMARVVGGKIGYWGRKWVARMFTT
jgi:Glycosyltransferases involved in cell wall biogenesis